MTCRIAALSLLAMCFSLGSSGIAEACGGKNWSLKKAAEDATPRTFTGRQPGRTDDPVTGTGASGIEWTVKIGAGQLIALLKWTVYFTDCTSAKIIWRLDDGTNTADIYTGNSNGSGQSQVGGASATSGDANWAAVMTVMGNSKASDIELVGILVCENPHSEEEFYRAKIKS